MEQGFGTTPLFRQSSHRLAAFETDLRGGPSRRNCEALCHDGSEGAIIGGKYRGFLRIKAIVIVCVHMVVTFKKSLFFGYPAWNFELDRSFFGRVANP